MFSIGSIFSAFLNSGNPSDAVQAAELQLESEVGNFLTTGQTVSDLKTQADGQRNSSNSIVAQKAMALSGQASSLLTEYRAIQADSQILINKIIDLKTKINQDPNKYADPGSSTYFGWTVLDVLNQNKQAVIQASSDSAAMIKRIASYKTAVNALSNDVASLINLAQGKGLSGALSTFGSSTTKVAEVGMAVGVGALAVYLLAPSFIPRMMRSLKGR